MKRDRRPIRQLIAVAAIALVVWGVINLYPLLQTPETDTRVYHADDLWTYGLGIGEGTQAVYNVYHAALERNVTVSYTVVEKHEDGTWMVSIEATDGEVKESAYAITKENIFPVSGSQLSGKIDRFAVAVKMPVVDFLMGLEDQPLIIGERWQMAFLAPDNTYTWSVVLKKEDVNGQEAFVIRYGPEIMPSYTWIAKEYPIPIRDEYNDPLFDETVSIYELIEYRN